jgi:surface-anchored protein
MNTRDGISGDDWFEIGAGDHAHFNWAFSAMGTYTLTFEASGTLVEDSIFTSSGPVDFTVQVVPEPGVAALLGLGGLLLLARRRRA